MIKQREKESKKGIRENKKSMRRGEEMMRGRLSR